MPVYDIAAGQRLAQPVTAMYEGKALRAGLKLDELAAKSTELQNEALKQSIDARLPERRVEADEARNDIYREAQERLRSNDEEELKRYQEELGVNAAIAAIEAYDSAPAEEKRAAGYEATLAVLDNAIPGGRDAVFEYLAEQGKQIGPESFDINEMRAVAAPYLEEKEKDGDKYQAKDTYVGEDGKEYHGWWDSSGRFHKTDILAKNPETGESVSYTPPNTNEIEAAEAIIEGDEQLDELNSDDKRVAAQMIASEIKQLQKAGKSYDEAAVMAISLVKTKLKTEKSRIFGSNTKLDIGSKGLADNEYRGSDGHIYVETEDGWRRKD